MVGGGKDAFIGSIHRLAANMDGLIEVVAGALLGDVPVVLVGPAAYDVHSLRVRADLARVQRVVN